MPKILINEKNLTSPGRPADYANYSVLIPGFVGQPANGSSKIPADANGVYEFVNAQQFLDTIGLREDVIVSGKVSGDVEFDLPVFGTDTVTKEKIEAESNVSIAHYGNRMAYELLNLGYSVIYKPLTDINEVLNDTEGLGSSAFWDIFRDKASYDFRFIVHGLVESNNVTESVEFNTLSDSQTKIASAKAALEEIFRAIKEEDANYNVESPALESSAEANVQYNELLTSGTGVVLEVLKPAGTVKYETFEKAVKGIIEEEKQIMAQIAIVRAPKSTVTTDLINKANKAIADLATYEEATEGTVESLDVPGRGDCTALIELDERLYTSNSGSAELAIINGINAMGLTDSNGTFCALTVPSVIYTNNKKFPGSFHYLACFISSLQKGFAEWYAAAGYTRGISSYTIKNTVVKLGEIAINALEPRYTIDGATAVQPKFACNVIANFRGSYYLWGNRTAHQLGTYGNETNGDLTACSFLNIRQLCSTIKKQLYVSCRRFTFDPNSDTLWINFVNAIKPTLEAMKADQGIRDYKIVKEATDKKATLKARIRIIPIEAVEDFSLTVSLEDSFGETAAVTGDIQ